MSEAQGSSAWSLASSGSGSEEDAPCARVACNFCLEDVVALLVVGNRLEVRVHIAFGGFHLEAWLTRC